MTKLIRWLISLLLVLSFQAVSIVSAQNLAEFEKKVTEFTLDNGLKFVLVERHEAPVVSFMTYADVGSVNERPGITGMAHLFEHMAFKGTTTIGAKDYKAEEVAIKKIDQVFHDLKKEQQKGKQADPKRLEELQKQFADTQKEADQFIVHDEFDKITQGAGAAELNADTAWDRTRYYFSLPSNKAELWFSLESDRFLNPVLREFYKERNVVSEERRLGENDPFSRLFEDFFCTAFKAHPYGNPIVGYMSDLKVLSREDAEQFFKTYYQASNLTCVIVGDIDPEKAKDLAKTYFGRLPKSEKPAPVETEEPEQYGERRCTIIAKSQPAVIIGYHRPAFSDADNAGFTVLTDIMGLGRTSRLYKDLVRDQKISIEATAMYLPMAMSKYPNLFIFYSIPSQNHTNEENEKALYLEIDKLKTALVTPEELTKAKTRVRASVIRDMESNMGLAGRLAFYDSVTHDWRNLFRELEDIDKVKAEDIQRIANQYFSVKNRTVGYLVPEEEKKQEEQEKK